jgi:polyisoprenoid-binding protein YceI
MQATSFTSSEQAPPVPSDNEAPQADTALAAPEPTATWAEPKTRAAAPLDWLRSRTTLVVLSAAVVITLAALIGYLVWVYGGNGSAATTGKGSPTATAASTLTPSAGQTVFTLDPSASQASFTTHETLLGRPQTVVGTTHSVAGQILIDLTDPQKSQVGQIKVDVSTLATDNDMRNNTLQGRILETGDSANQYASFSATNYIGLPTNVTIGQTVTFKVTGNLTIHSVTKQETFDVTLTVKSASQVTGTATTVVRYADFGMSIPNVPQVSDVSDNVTLSLAFTANANG